MDEEEHLKELKKKAKASLARLAQLSGVGSSAKRVTDFQRREAKKVRDKILERRKKARKDRNRRLEVERTLREIDEHQLAVEEYGGESAEDDSKGKEERGPPEDDDIGPGDERFFENSQDDYFEGEMIPEDVKDDIFDIVGVNVDEPYDNPEVIAEQSSPKRRRYERNETGFPGAYSHHLFPDKDEPIDGDQLLKGVKRFQLLRNIAANLLFPWEARRVFSRIPNFGPGFIPRILSLDEMRRVARMSKEDREEWTWPMETNLQNNISRFVARKRAGFIQKGSDYSFGGYNYGLGTGLTRVETPESYNKDVLGNFALPILNTGTLQCLNLISQGTSMSQRIGNQINMTLLRLRLMLKLTGNANPIASVCRILIIYDRQPNGEITVEGQTIQGGVYPTWSEMFGNMDATGEEVTYDNIPLWSQDIFLANVDRFSVLFDKIVTLPPTAPALTLGITGTLDGHTNGGLTDPRPTSSMTGTLDGHVNSGMLDPRATSNLPGTLNGTPNVDPLINDNYAHTYFGEQVLPQFGVDIAERCLSVVPATRDIVQLAADINNAPYYSFYGSTTATLPNGSLNSASNQVSSVVTTLTTPSTIFPPSQILQTQQPGYAVPIVNAYDDGMPMPTTTLSMKPTLPVGAGASASFGLITPVGIPDTEEVLRDIIKGDSYADMTNVKFTSNADSSKMTNDSTTNASKLTNDFSATIETQSGVSIVGPTELDTFRIFEDIELGNLQTVFKSDEFEIQEIDDVEYYVYPISNIFTGALYLVAIGDQASGVDPFYVTGNSRVYFFDGK